MQKATKVTPVELSDGRMVKVCEYPNLTVRLKVSGINGWYYAMTECFLPGSGHEAIIKLEMLRGDENDS